MSKKAIRISLALLIGVVVLFIVAFWLTPYFLSPHIATFLANEVENIEFASLKLTLFKPQLILTDVQFSSNQTLFSSKTFVAHLTYTELLRFLVGVGTLHLHLADTKLLEGDKEVTIADVAITIKGTVLPKEFEKGVLKSLEVQAQQLSYLDSSTQGALSSDSLELGVRGEYPFSQKPFSWEKLKDFEFSLDNGEFGLPKIPGVVGLLFSSANLAENQLFTQIRGEGEISEQQLIVKQLLIESHLLQAQIQARIPLGKKADVEVLLNISELEESLGQSVKMIMAFMGYLMPNPPFYVDVSWDGETVPKIAFH
ncbi:MAG: hypothetical protein ACOXZ4_02535 [Sphaerochaetaceae bacterium]